MEQGHRGGVSMIINTKTTSRLPSDPAETTMWYSGINWEGFWCAKFCVRGALDRDQRLRTC